MRNNKQTHFASKKDKGVVGEHYALLRMAIGLGYSHYTSASAHSQHNSTSLKRFSPIPSKNQTAVKRWSTAHQSLLPPSSARHQCASKLICIYSTPLRFSFFFFFLMGEAELVIVVVLAATAASRTTRMLHRGKLASRRATLSLNNEKTSTDKFRGNNVTFCIRRRYLVFL